MYTVPEAHARDLITLLRRAQPETTTTPQPHPATQDHPAAPAQEHHGRGVRAEDRAGVAEDVEISGAEGSVDDPVDVAAASAQRRPGEVGVRRAAEETSRAGAETGGETGSVMVSEDGSKTAPSALAVSDGGAVSHGREVDGSVGLSRSWTL